MGEWIQNAATVSPLKPSPKRKPGMMRWIRRHGEGGAAAICGLLTLTAWLGESWLGGMTVGLYLLAYGIGGYGKAWEGIRALVRERRLDVNLLMFLAAAGAAGIGHWMEGAVLIFIFALSGALETYAEQKSHRDLSSLMKMKPEKAHRLEEGRVRVVPIEELRPGDRVIVKPGEQIPADGVVTEGASAVNQSAITGESVPVEKRVSDEVFAGTLNGQGSLVVEVTRANDSSLFARMVRLVREAKNQHPPSQQWIEKFERIYVQVVLLMTVMWLTLPPLVMGWSWGETVYRAMVFLVVASPCAVVASIMPAVLSAMSNGARKGLLFKGGSDLEKLSGVRVVAFDKTGTLTRGELRVTDLIPAEGLTEQELLRAAAAVESLSEHPIARAVVKEAEARGLNGSRPSRFESVTGCGVQARWEGQTWKVGKTSFSGDKGAEPWIPLQKRLEQEGKTVIWVANERGVAGLIGLQDQIRPEVGDVIRRLKQLGVRVVMLTGDRHRTAQAIAAQAGMEEVCAELLPEEKVDAVRRLREVYGPVAMVGDGVNDAPALAVADAGIAMGAAGSDVALDTARVVLMNDDLRNIPVAVALGKRMRSIVKQNLAFAVSVILLLILANVAGGITLPFGVVGHEGSTILVILNGLRLLQ